MTTSAQKKSAGRSKALEIHVLGAGKGESIVLHWPEGKWGVIDCYAPSVKNSDTNPTLQFLLDRGVSELEFLCLTHPHDDHFRGMSHLLERLSVKHFWRFPGLGGRDLKQLAKYMIEDAERSGSGEMTENANDFLTTLGLVKSGRDAGRIKEMRVSGNQRLYPVPYDDSAVFQVWSFAPSGNQVAHYENALASCFTPEGRFREQLPQASHNSVSVGLFVRFGATKVVLCGDVERACWGDLNDEISSGDLPAHAVKVGHHGSETGYVPGLWERLTGKQKPIAVIAPYRRFHLPKPEALDHIRPHVSKILSTCPVEDATTPGPVSAPLRSRLFLRSQLNARPAPPVSRCGRCSLTYDAEGNCLEAACVSPAQEL